MKKLLIVVGLSSLTWLIYVLFQPIIDWNFGWQKIPKNRSEVSFAGVEDSNYEEAIKASKQHLDTIIELSNAPSISVAAMIQGRMVWSYALGFMDLVNRIPADTITQYRIGSVSKALTSLGLGKMIEEEQIHLDSSVQRYTALFQNKSDISIRQLASHQSGIRNYSVCFCFPLWEYYRNEEFQSIAQSVVYFEKDALLFEPGESFSYSTYNFTALSLAMEKATGRNFLSYMGEYVFSPLQMENTEADKRMDQTNKAMPYETTTEKFKDAFEVNLSNKWAGGGFVSTPSDLVRAGNALLDTIFLDKTTRETLISPQRLNDGSINEQNYALGWRHGISERYFDGEVPVEVIHHGGMAVGGLALLLVYPEYDLVIAITMNKSGLNGRFELFDYIVPMVNAFMKKQAENDA
ncbi:serine hydrolase domain-containing protein [Ekhidna sp. MALMAid0563]|uniref:serine hydrolase domain-containing protein n=1 Tax=Ekhidna sp. MALMAid0563 TaxID=3143937 RepID=UPI0032E04499